MSAPRIGSLCSGYGGLDMAVMDAVPGAEVAWHAQYEPPDKNGKPDTNQYAAHWKTVPGNGPTEPPGCAAGTAFRRRAAAPPWPCDEGGGAAADLDESSYRPR